ELYNLGNFDAELRIANASNLRKSSERQNGASGTQMPARSDVDFADHRLWRWLGFDPIDRHREGISLVRNPRSGRSATLCGGGERRHQPSGGLAGGWRYRR